MNPCVPIFRGLDARGGRKLRTDRQTDRYTHGTTTVTLAAHTRRGLIMLECPAYMGAVRPTYNQKKAIQLTLLHVHADVTCTPANIPIKNVLNLLSGRTGVLLQVATGTRRLELTEGTKEWKKMIDENYSPTEEHSILKQSEMFAQ